MQRFLTMLLPLIVASSVVVAEPDSSEVLAQFPFTAEQKQQIMQGKLVHAMVDDGSEHAPTGYIGFVVDKSLDDIKQHFLLENWGKSPEHIVSKNLLRAPIALTDITVSKFDKEEIDEVMEYVDALPGERLNLSDPELKQFLAVKQQASRQQAVEYRLQKLLFARLQDYRKGGVSAIAPYQRADGQQLLLGDYFISLSAGEQYLEANYPAFFAALNGYPSTMTNAFQESFFALKSTLMGRPAFALMHRLAVEENNALLLMLRQFYVSHSYNGEQDLGLFVPVKKGVLVLGIFRKPSASTAGTDGRPRPRLLAHSMIRYHQQLQSVSPDVEAVKQESAAKQ